MRTIKLVVREELEILDIICNMCGESLKVPPTEFYNYGGLVGACVEGVYGSKYFADGVEYRFDLCEKCISKVVDLFKIPPETNGVGL